MINANLSGAPSLFFQLGLYEVLGSENRAGFDTHISGKIQTEVLGWLKIAELIATEMQAKSALGRISHFRHSLKRSRLTWKQLSFQCQALREAFIDGFKWQMLYRYPDEKRQVVSNWRKEWKSVCSRFPSTQSDVVAAVDCWALGHATASVFHAMRVLEYGLAALAKNVGREVGTHNWQNVIDQIESAVREEAKSLPGGVTKAARLRFLSEAAKELSYFKDGWRNHVSHNRATYGEAQALSILVHVRNFMTVLSEKLSEESLP